MTQRRRLIEALRTPVHDRVPVRRSTVLIAAVLIILTVLYGAITPSTNTKAVTLCSADGKCSTYVQAPSSNSNAPKIPATTVPPSTTTAPTTAASTTTTTPTTTPPTSPNRSGTTVPATTIPRSATTTTTLPGGTTTTSSTSAVSTTSTTSIP